MYIKQFENFDSNEEIEFISEDQFYYYDGKYKSEPFKQKEIDRIKEILYPYVEELSGTIELAKNSTTPESILDFNHFNGERILEIWKLEDEWFIITNWEPIDPQFQFCKCDQFRALEKYLKEIKFKN